MLGLQFLLPYSGPPSESDTLAVRRPRLATLLPLPEYPAILRSPVIAPDRRPGQAGLPSPGGGALEGWAALGAAAGGGAATGVVSGPGGAVKTLRQGETLEGWRLATVDRMKLTFERNGARHVLDIGAPAEVLARAAAAPPTDAGAAPQ